MTGLAIFPRRKKVRFGSALGFGAIATVIAIAANSQALAAAPADRPTTKVVVWGTDTAVRAVPSDLRDAVAISAGYNHVLALRSNGTVVGWGHNTGGETIPPAELRHVIAIAAGLNYSLALLADGTVRSWGRSAPAVPADLTHVVAISAGSHHALALLADGTVRAFGETLYGRLQPPADLRDVLAVAAGQDQSYALKSDGSVVAWGVSDQLADAPRPMGAASTPSATDDAALTVQNTQSALTGQPIVGLATRALHTLELRPDGTVASFGSADSAASSLPNSVAALNDIKAIATGVSHNLVLRANGSVVEWGSGSSALLEVPKNVREVLAVAAGRTFSVALLRS